MAVLAEVDAFSQPGHPKVTHALVLQHLGHGETPVPVGIGFDDRQQAGLARSVLKDPSIVTNGRQVYGGGHRGMVGALGRPVDGQQGCSARRRVRASLW